MNDQPLMPPPETPDEEAWENAMQETTRHFIYPPTPDIAGQVRIRLKRPSRSPVRAWRLAAAALVALLVFSMAVPEVRAFVLEVLRIGAVQIFFVEPTQTSNYAASETLSLTGTPDPTPSASALDLPGETTLVDAEAQSGNRILLPAYPADLGAPDHVYLERLGGWVVTLAWMQPDDPAEVRLILQILNPDGIGVKYYPWDNTNQESTRVHDSQAIWLTDVHEIFYHSDDREVSRLIDTNVLIWEQDRLTYRLETDLTIEEAVRIAESLG
jgi:hypothetical protein